MKAKKAKIHKLRRNKAGKAVAILRRAFAEAAKAGCIWDFWSLVTGLRGPDKESVLADNAKDAGTEALRRACWPSSTPDCGCFTFRPRGWNPQLVRRLYWRDLPPHWQRHIKSAIAVCHEAFGTTRSDEGGQESGEDA